VRGQQQCEVTCSWCWLLVCWILLEWQHQEDIRLMELKDAAAAAAATAAAAGATMAKCWGCRKGGWLMLVLGAAAES
jgi:hypothetical protein